MKKIYIIILLIFILSPLAFVRADGVGEKMRGRILLQVEGRGEAWYVDATSGQRHYLGKPEDAISVMREVGVGISNADLMKIPIAKDSYIGLDSDSDGLSDKLEDSIGTDKGKFDTDNDGYGDGVELKDGYNPRGTGKIVIDRNFTVKQQGRILLQVEKNGEAWYVDPVKGERYLLGSPADAFQVMRRLGVGISNSDLAMIDQSGKAKETVTETPTDKAVAQKALYFVNQVLLNSSQSNAELQGVEDMGDVYMIKLKNGDTVIDSYITKDGKFFFPQGFDMDAEIAIKSKPSTKEIVTDGKIIKRERPKVELYVMSHCPYGTQIEKGILPVVEALGDTIDFKIKFVNYAMHGEKEIDEQLNQYCIQKEQSDKYLAYLKCFLSAGEGDICLDGVGVNFETLDNCVSATDAEYGIHAAFDDKSTWTSGRYPSFPIYSEECVEYGVSGSPTLVINGAKVTTARSSSALLEKICSAYIVMPDACATQMSDINPSPGFGYVEGNGGDGTASCE